MNVLGVIGSPRGERGRSYEVVQQVLEGAAQAGAETEMLLLIDEEPAYCVHCGHGCFDDGVCIQEEGATARSQRVSAADALVVCAPVYCWQPSGLTAAFFDKLRLASGPWSRGNQNGRPALGIAVAGGSGTGVFAALQSIYAWLCLWKFRPLDPLPVTRFNADRVLEEAASLGRALAEGAPQPFEGTWDLMLTYDRLPYMDYGRVDEFRWLARQIVEGLARRPDREAEQEEALGEMRRLLYEARVHATRGDQEQEAQKCVAAYRLGAKVWPA
jgi:multimeric flavodoxin WrbA